MGASYIGYGFTAMITVAFALAYVLLFPTVNEWVVIGAILVTIAILLPLIFRYGRTLMLHLMGGAKFDQGLTQKKMVVGRDGALREIDD